MTKNTSNAELNALRDQHEITVMELTDLKQDYEKIKKLNTTLVQNFNKGPEDTLRQIKLIIDGSFQNQRILELQSEIQKLNNTMEENVSERVKEIMDNFDISKKITESQQIQQLQNSHKCQKCQNLSQKLSHKNAQIKNLHDQQSYLQEQIEILRNKIKHNQQTADMDKNISLEELKQINKILENNLRIMQDRFQQQMRLLDQEWHRKYEHVLDQLDIALDELKYYQEDDKIHRLSKVNKENYMKKQIQNLVGELGNCRAGNKFQQQQHGKKTISKSKVSTSNLDSDYSNFSIKDAINRPTQINLF